MARQKYRQRLPGVERGARPQRDGDLETRKEDLSG